MAGFKEPKVTFRGCKMRLITDRPNELIGEDRQWVRCISPANGEATVGVSGVGASAEGSVFLPSQDTALIAVRMRRVQWGRTMDIRMAHSLPRYGRMLFRMPATRKPTGKAHRSQSAEVQPRSHNRPSIAVVSEVARPIQEDMGIEERRAGKKAQHAEPENSDADSSSLFTRCFRARLWRFVGIFAHPYILAVQFAR